MPFMNFRIVNAKNLKMEFKEKLLKYGISIHWDFNHQLAHRYKRGFEKKPRAVKLKI